MDASHPTTIPERAAPSRLATLLALELRRARTGVVHRWLDRIVARVTIDKNDVFPSEELLNHVPLLVDGIADYLVNDRLDFEGRLPVEAKAMELGALRHKQGFDAHQILKEHEILSGILFTFLGDALTRIAPDEYVSADVALVWRRVAEATDEIRRATMTHFLRVSAEQVRHREERLRRFNRMVSHELKNRVGAIRGASALLAEPWLDTSVSRGLSRTDCAKRDPRRDQDRQTRSEHVEHAGLDRKGCEELTTPIRERRDPEHRRHRR